MHYTDRYSKCLTNVPTGGSDVALCELTYYYHNIRGAGRVSNEHTTVLVPNGYYNACELDEEVFKPLGAKLHLDTHTGLIQLATKNDNIVPGISSRLVVAQGLNSHWEHH